MSQKPASSEHSIEVLRLDNQLCFALYGAANRMTRLYRPLLDALGLTYPQYLAMLVLWEKNPRTVGALGEALDLDSSTLTPLLKRLEAAGLVERSRDPDDERRVIEHILPKGMATITAHLEHLASHGQDSWHAQAIQVLKEKHIVMPAPAEKRFGTFQPLRADSSAQHRVDNGMSGGCAASAAMAFGPSSAGSGASSGTANATRLEQWPVQLHLINPRAPYFKGADLLIAADCTAYACGAFHQVLLAGRRLIIACPKLDTGKEVYIDKIRALVRDAGVASITIAIMDVACCGGLKRLVSEALAGIEHNVPISTVVVSAKGGALTWL